MDIHKESPIFFETSSEATAWIIDLKSLGIKPGLARMHALMEMLDHPEQRLRFIHVAGTNGKGSTCAFLSEAIHRCGYDVGCFTSPYIETYADRIRFNGQPITDAALVDICNRLKPFVEQCAATELGSPTMFEVTTVLALLYFAKYAQPDFVVWETGLGGRLDSTNIIHPLVTIITNIGYDHMDILGDTLSQIAYEKAGILKSGVSLITAIQEGEAKQVVTQMAKEKKVNMYVLGEQFGYTRTSNEMNQQRFDFRGPFRDLKQLSISMNGEHQVSNAALAMMTIEILRTYYALYVDDEHLYQAFFHTVWPGRLEMISLEYPILLDGAHNPEGAQALAKSIREDYIHTQVHMMVGMLSTKNHEEYFKQILPCVHTLIVTEVDFPKSSTSHHLAEVANRVILEMNLDVTLIIEPIWKQAVQRLQALQHKNDLLVVTGSLYLVSDVRAWLLDKTLTDKGW